MAENSNETAMVLGDATLAKRFWAKVNLAGPNDCWEWTAGRSAGRYGAIKVGGKHGRDLKAHRVQAVWRGDDVAGRVVMHTCDNTVCVNPAHLVTSTQLDNVQDMIAKGRENKPVGEAHGNSYLSDSAVAEILVSLHGGNTVKGIAESLGLPYLLVYRIAKRTAYAHVRPELVIEVNSPRKAARQRSSLSEEKVEKMRLSYRNCGSYTQVAREFSLSRVTAMRIIKGQRWG